MSDICGRFQKIALAVTISTALTSVGYAHDVLPTGGTFVGGSGVITQQGHDMTVNQSSHTGVVDWNTFSIGQHNGVDIINHGGATLNRVTGGDASVIAGSLHSDGTVFLINQNGVVITGSGSVVTSGNFVASTRDTTDGTTFSGTGKGKIVNRGTIKGQDVVLIGHDTKNSGNIIARDTVALISGDKITYQQDRGITVSGGKHGLVTNAGTISGRDAVLASGGNIYALAAHGAQSATASITTTDGIYLGGDNITVDSKLHADGNVDIAAYQNARVGGRSDLVGENIHIAGHTTPTANLKIASGAVLHARKTIETSAHNVSIGNADIKAKAWTLDPDNLTIDTATAATIESSLNSGTNVTQQTEGGTTGSGAGDIIVNADISWGSSAKLTLSAFNDIFVNGKITVSGSGALDLETGNNVGGTSATGTYVETGRFADATGTITFTNETASPSLVINGSTYNLIYTSAELAALTSGNHNYALAKDIDLSSISNWTPLNQTYSGTNFNGLGHVISNLTQNITGYSTHAGLFDENTAVLSNLGVAAHITSTTAGGGIIAYQQNADARNVWSSGVINTTNMAGGLFGYQNNWASGTHDLYDSHSTATVEGSGPIGGLIGLGWNIRNSWFSGTITGTGSAAGGIVGSSSGASAMPATISDSYSAGSISGASAVGGLVGAGGSYLNIANSYSTAAVSSSNGYAGGIVGTFTASSNANYGLTGVYSTGNVTGPEAGGLVGNAQDITISDSYSTGNVTGTNSNGGTAGGLIANASASDVITNSYSTSTVSAAGADAGHAGGLVGVTDDNELTIRNAYSYGSQQGYATGGVVAENAVVSESNVYYLGSGTDSNGGVGLSYAQFAAGNAMSGLGSAFRQADFNRPVLANFNTAKVSLNDSTLQYGQSFSDLSPTVSSITDLSSNPVSIDLSGNSYIATGAVAVGNTLPEVGTISAQNGYQVTYSGNLTVNPADLTITANNASSVYGTTPTLSGYTVSGLVNGDTVTGADVATTATSASGVGQYAITAKNAQISDASNYNITYSNGTLTVNPADLTITANNASSVYGTTPVLNGVTATGLVNGDTVTGADVSTTANAKSGVGSYQINASDAQGQHLSDYNITYGSGTLNITPADLTITANNATSVYGATPVLNGVTATGLVNGDTATADVSTTANAKSSVGQYAITASDAQMADSGNYNITYSNGILTVNPANLTITANSASSVYGSTSVLNGYTVSGLVNGDTVTGADVVTAANATSGVGQYAITAQNAQIADSGNYNITYSNGILNITPADLTITANNATSVYGSTPVLDGYAVSGLVNGDTVTADVSTTANASSGVGRYAITAGNAQGQHLSDYNISYSNGALSITPAELVIAANNTSSVYGSTPVLNGYTVSGLVNGDTVTGADVSTTANASSGVGRYAITASDATGTGLGNYNISYGSGILTVNPADLTITANNASSVYGSTPVLNGYTTSGLVNGDTVTADVSTTANASSNVGRYAITAQNAQGQHLSDYNISYSNGALNITPADLVITTLNQKATEGAVVLDEDGYTVSGLVNGDTVTGADITTTANAASGVGNYAISASDATGTGLANYDITYDNSGVLTVNAAPVAPVTPVTPVTPVYSSGNSWVEGAVLDNIYLQTARKDVSVRLVNCQITFNKKRYVSCGRNNTNN